MRASSQISAHLRADGADVDPRLLAEPGEDAVRSGGDLLERRVVWHGGEDDVRGLGDLPRRVAPFQTLLDQLLGVRPASLRAEDRVAGGEKPRRHVAAHVTKADETDAGASSGHGAALSLRRRVAAAGHRGGLAASWLVTGELGAPPHLETPDPAGSLNGFDAYPLFTALGDSVVTGPTNNNLRDLRIFLSR